MKRRHIVLLGILAVLVLAALIYTRPMTLQQIGKVDIAQCESVSGYHRRAPDSEFTSFEPVSYTHLTLPTNSRV